MATSPYKKVAIAMATAKLEKTRPSRCGAPIFAHSTQVSGICQVKVSGIRYQVGITDREIT